MNPLIINFTPTGMIPTKEQTPYVPISPAEIIDQVHEAYDLGITIAHLHARDADGQPTSRATVYEQIVAGVRRHAPDLIVCLSLSGRRVTDLASRAEPLQLDGDLRPDMGSLTLSSLNFPQQASQNSPETIQGLCAIMREKGIIPELEAFDAGMVNYAKYLMHKKLIGPPYYFNLIFGNIASAQADLLHTGLTLRELPPDCDWAFGGIGASQLPMNALAIALGGGVRVGLEDNLYFDAGRKRLARNIELLKRVHDLAALHGRSVMPPAHLRARWGIVR